VDLGLIRSIAINQMTMDFTTTNPWAPTMSSNSVVATMLSIPGITLPIDSVRQHVIVTDEGVQLGAFDTPWSASNVKGSSLTTAFTTSALNIFPESKAAFPKFISSLSTKASHPVTLKGAVDAKLNLGIFGHLTIPGIGFNAVVPFKGLDSLKQMKFIYAIEIAPKEDLNTYLTSIVTITNPSDLTLKLGNVNFVASSRGEYIGTTSVRDLVLVPGDNQVLAYSVIEVAKYPAAQRFSDGLNTNDEIMELSTSSNASTNPALNAGLATLRNSLTVPQFFGTAALSQVPFKDWSIKISPTKVATVTATFQSPYYGIPLEFTNAIPPTGFLNNIVGAPGMTVPATEQTIWTFKNALKFKVGGTGSTTVSFEVDLPKNIIGAQLKGIQDMIAYGKQNGYILFKINWLPAIILAGDGVERNVDWSTDGNGFESFRLAVGDDFANILL
ncbi:hypothetical protein FBU30_002564, partial [Linnemannia zychae]